MEKYKIAVICPLFSDFIHHFREQSSEDVTYKPGAYIKNEFHYQRVGHADHVRGERFDGYVVTGAWENSAYWDTNYYEIIDAIKFCFSE